MPGESGYHSPFHRVDWREDRPRPPRDRGGVGGANHRLRSGLRTTGGEILVGTNPIRLRPATRWSAPDRAGGSSRITTRGIATSRHGFPSLIGLDRAVSAGQWLFPNRMRDARMEQ